MKIIIYILSLFLLTASALAANLNVPDSVDFYAEQGETVSEDFTIKGDVELTNIVFTDDTLGYGLLFSEDDETYTPTLTMASLAAGVSKKIYVKATIPDEEVIGTRDIGKILINADGGISEEIILTEHIGGLDIIDVDAKIGKREESFKDLEDGNQINPDYTRPGEPVKFEIDIENLFSDDSDNDIDNIRITVAIIGIEAGDDLEEEVDNIDLKTKESHRETFEFDIPIEVEEGEYDVSIDIEGEDKHNIKREVHWTLKLNVEKQSHDVVIRTASLSPTKIICGGTSVLSTTIYNFGRSTEDEVKVTIESSGLGINIEEFPIELDNDLLEDESKWSKSFSIPVSKTQKSGTYSIEMRLYYSEDALNDYRKLDLVVEECVKEEGKKEEEPVCGNGIIETGEECDDGNTLSNDGCSALCKTEEIEEEEPEEEEEERITGTVITETEEEPGNWIMVLVGINVLVIAIVIVLLFLMFRKKEGKEK